MMSDLADIAAAAGISIIDTPLGEDGDKGYSDNTQVISVASRVKPDESGDTSLVAELQDLETLFDNRFTDEDPEYAKTVRESEFWSRPPCVEDYFGRRQRDRDNNRQWQRGRGFGDHHRGHYRDGRGHQGRGDYHYHQNWNEQRGYARSRDRNSHYENRGDGYYRRERDRSPR